MTKEYIPVSQREGIKSKAIADIADYIERHSKTFELSKYEEGHFIGFYFDKFRLVIHDEREFLIYRKKKSLSCDVLKGDLKILANNYVGIYASIRNKI